MYSYKNFKFWNKTKLWNLRNEIVLNSLYISDYENSFGIPAAIVCEFFDSYISYLDELMTENGECLPIDDFFNKYDTKENLWNWWYCYDICPFSYS